jgi:sigma-B regulation protein RsbU (phosphoserine phosphatase)
MACHAFAVGSVVLALGTTEAVAPLREQPPLLLFFAAVILTRWYAGRVAGWLAIGLSLGAIHFAFVAPNHPLPLEIAEDGLDFAAFVAATWLVGSLQSRWRRTSRAMMAMEDELATARRIQQRLFPSAPPTLEGWEVGGACFPAGAASGDFFDYLPMPDGCLGIVCGDVSGHGLGPALIMALTRSYLRSRACEHSDPGEILTKANRLVYADTEEERFVTVVLVRLDPKTRSVVYAGAGHEAFLVGASGENVTLPSTGGPLGIEETASIASGSERIFEPEQILLLLSDGIVETIAPDGEAFGMARVFALVQRLRREPIAAIIQALHQAVCDHAGDAAPADDMTIVLVRAAADSAGE